LLFTYPIKILKKSYALEFAHDRYRHIFINHYLLYTHAHVFTNISLLSIYLTAHKVKRVYVCVCVYV